MSLLQLAALGCSFLPGPSAHAPEPGRLAASTESDSTVPEGRLAIAGAVGYIGGDLPVIRVVARVPTIVEGEQARFRFTRDGDLSGRLILSVTITQNGDFLGDEIPESVQFTAGSDAVTLALTTRDDILDERDGEVRLTLEKNDEYEISGSGTAVVRIRDNDEPPAVTIGNARVAESTGSIAFPVTIIGASAYEVTVNWLSGDLTARAGQDYQAAGGRLTLVPGETSRTIRVAVVDDLLPEEDETFSISLTGATNAVLDVASATGTIMDDDEGVTLAWLSRFGRTVASQVVDGIGARLVGSGTGGSPTANTATAAAPDGAGRDPGPGDLLDGAFFRFSTDPAPMERSFPLRGITAWGRGFGTGFGGSAGDVDVEGSVLTGLAGVDYEHGRFLGGVAVSYSLGDGTLTRAASEVSGERSQDVQSSLGSLYPYLRVKVNERTSVWGLGGRGWGEMSFPGAGARPGTGIRMSMGAIGARGALLQPGEAGLEVALRSDVFMVRMNTLSDVAADVIADVNRVRVLVEGSKRVRLGAVHGVAVTLEAGARHDGGDAETGIGAEAGGTLRYTNGALGLGIEATGRMMLVHQGAGFSEWGVGGALVFQPAGPNRGLSLRMNASRGVAVGSAADFWSSHRAGNMAARGRAGTSLPDGSAGRLVTQVHYAMNPFGEAVTMAPFAELDLFGPPAASDSRVGWRVHFRGSPRLSIETHLSPGRTAGRGRGLALRGSLVR